MRARVKSVWRLGVLAAALAPMLAFGVDLALTSSWDSFMVWAGDSGLAPTIATPGFTVVDPDGDGRDDIIMGVSAPLSAFRRITYSAPDGRYFIDRSVANPYPLGDQLDPDLRLITSLTTGGPLKAITWQKHSIAVYDLASGRLERLSDPSGYEWPIPVCAIDVDGDGAKEIVVRDTFSVHVVNSTLTRELSFISTPRPTNSRSSDAVCGNLDADPALEVAIDNGDIYEFTGFTLHKQGSVDNVADGTPQYAGSADIDGDGNDELFVVYGEVGVVRVHNLESAAPAWAIDMGTPGARILAARVVDINRDGVKDLLVVTLRGDNTGDIIGFNGANGHELVKIAKPDLGVFAINAGNFDNDAGTEIAVALFRPFSRPNRLYIYNAATGALKWRSEDEVGPITAAAMRDLDRDGQPEVVVAVRGVYGVGDIRLLAFDANTFQRRWTTSHQILPVTGAGDIASLAMGDVDGDGDDEIVIGMQKDGIAQVVIVDGATRAFVRMIPLAGFQYVEAIALHDFDGDGDQEIVAAASAPYGSEYGGETFILDGANGQTVAHGGLGTYQSRHLTSVRVGDVTGDGHADIVAAGVSAQGFGGVVFIMDGVTHAVRGEVGGPGFEGLALVDVNGDGVLEIALGSSDGNLAVRRASDLSTLRTLAPCSTPIHAISTNNLPGALPGQVFYSCDDRVGGADLRAGGAAMGMTGMVGFRVGNGNVLLATGTAAAPTLTTTTILGLRHLTPSANTAGPYIVPGNHDGPAVFSAERNATMTGRILFGNFSGRPTQLELVEGTQSGQFTFANGGFTYRMTTLRSVDNFTVRATDGVSQSVPMTFSIVIRNSPPIVPNNSEFTATPGLQLLTPSGAMDPDGDNLQFTLVTAPTKGTLAFRVDGSFTYTPDATATGDDTFEYSASDSLRAAGNNGSVVIHIQAAAPPPPPPPPPPSPNPPAAPPSGGGGGGAFDFTSLTLLLCALVCAQRRTRHRSGRFR